LGDALHAALYTAVYSIRWLLLAIARFVHPAFFARWIWRELAATATCSAVRDFGQ
jgi:hypothetical protein